MVAVPHDSVGAERRRSRGRPLASHQHRGKHAAPAKLTKDTETAKTPLLPDFEAFLILTPMAAQGGRPTKTFQHKDTKAPRHQASLLAKLCFVVLAGLRDHLQRLLSVVSGAEVVPLFE